MANDPSLGFVLTRQNSHVQLIRKDDGGVSLVDLRTLAALDFDAAERDQLRELLDRAAMPGQVAASEPARRGRVLAACRSCGAAIEWGKDPQGKRVPVDADGRADGNLAVQEKRGGGLHVRYLRKDGVLTVHEWRATSHFATCPDAAKWRERGTTAD